MPNLRSIASGLAKAVEPAAESKAVGNAALEQMRRTLDQKRLGVWDGKEPYDVWKARREAEIAPKFADGGKAKKSKKKEMQPEKEAALEKELTRRKPASPQDPVTLFTNPGAIVERTSILPDNSAGFVFSSDAGPFGQPAEPVMFMREQESPEDFYIKAHEAEHLLQRRGLGDVGNVFGKFSDLAGGEDAARSFVFNILSAYPHLQEKYNLNEPYFDRRILNQIPAKDLLAEQLASLGAIEQAHNVDLTQDPILRESLFKDPIHRRTFRAMTGLRQTRLDAKDLPPYTLQEDYKNGGLAMATGGQAFPLQPEFEAEVDRLRSRPRTRAGVPVEDTNVLGGALQGLANMLGGATFGRLVGTAGMPADIFEPMAAPGATIPMFGMAGMPTEISKALVQQFAPKGPDIPVPTSEFLLEKGLEKFKPAQEFEQAAKIGRFAPFDIAEMQAAGRKLKALQPALGELLEAQMKPYQMGVAPEGKMSKEEYSRMMREKYAAQNLAQQEKKATAADLKPQEVKVPADELGFYSPAEKAAANLKRNIGTGEAFLSDLKKAPDVGESDLVHTGLENWLKGKKTVSKQEIQDYMKNNRISFIKDELKAGEGSLEELRFPRQGDVIEDEDYIRSVAEDYANDWDSMGWRSRDEIREEILNQHGEGERQELINSGHIDELVDDEIRDLAYQVSRDQYYDNPYYEWQNDAGYYITGNDDVGYIVRDPRGRDITPRNTPYDFETAEGAVMMDAQERGIYAEGGTQYHDYQLEGPSSNYREHLTRLNRSKGRDDLQRELEEVHRAMDDPLDQEQYNSLSRRFKELKDELSNHHRPYESSHWDGPDVVSHSRTSDRVDLDNNEILHVDEIQSDWHQDGAEFGYANKETRQKYKDLMKERSGLAVDFTELRDSIPQLQHTAYHYETMKEMNPNYEKDFIEARSKLDAANARSKEIADQIDQINMQLSDFERAVPDAPFKKDWVEKELKKLLKIAAEEGKTKITLSTWQDQLKRWGTDSIAFTRLPGTIDGNNVWNVVATKGRKIKPSDLDDTITPEDIFYLNTLRNNDQRITTKNELRQVVKRDLSKGWSNAHIDRVTNKVWDQMNGLEVNEIGAIDPRKEGFKATYGKSFIDTMNKLAKKLGTKTGTTRIDQGYGEIGEKPHIEVVGKAASSAKKGQPYKEGGAVHPAVDKFASSLPHPAVDKFVKRMAQGGAVYNTIPDISDAEKMIQGPAF
jgi:hypothetical protein